MRFVSAASLAVFASATLAFAQEEAPPVIAPDPSLDALSEPVGPEDELEALSHSSDEPFPELEAQKKREPVSVTLRALDKITARYTDIEAMIDETVKFGSLEILPRYCDKRPPEEFPETTAFLEIFDRSRDNAEPDYKDAALAAEMEAVAAEAAKNEASPNTDEYSVEASMPKEAFSLDSGAPAESSHTDEPFDAEPEPATPSKPVDPDRVFEGWMFASTPALNALEHPVYDVWVIDCKTVVVDK